MPAHSKMQSPAVTQHPDVRLCGCAEESIASYNYSSLNVSAILLSCVLGTIVSLSTLLTIGAMSSLSYTVIGHIKTVSNLIGGYMFFGDTFTPIQIMGILLSLVGIFWFSTVRQIPPVDLETHPVQLSVDIPCPLTLLLSGFSRPALVGTARPSADSACCCACSSNPQKGSRQRMAQQVPSPRCPTHRCL